MLLIVKKRTMPMEILIYDAVLRRLPDRHPRKAEFELKLLRWKAGYKGERELDYFLTQFPDDDYTIIQNLRLPHKETHFQIDTLLVTPFFITNIESKNHAGEVEIDPVLDQMIQTIDGTKKSYLNPILQAEIQSAHLGTWLANHRFPRAPIEYFVTFSNPQTIIRNPTGSKEVAYRICRAPRIPFRIQSMKPQFTTPIFTKKEIKKAARLLVKSHVPLIPDPSKMNIPFKDLLTGVQCPKCSKFRMNRTHGTWFCSFCGHTSKDAHIPALKDYFLLFGRTITNNQMRDFLAVDSKDYISRLLKSLNLVTAGAKKNKLYTPPNDYFD